MGMGLGPGPGRSPFSGYDSTYIRSLGLRPAALFYGPSVGRSRAYGQLLTHHHPTIPSSHPLGHLASGLGTGLAPQMGNRLGQAYVRLRQRRALIAQTLGEKPFKNQGNQAKSVDPAGSYIQSQSIDTNSKIGTLTLNKSQSACGYRAVKIIRTNCLIYIQKNQLKKSKNAISNGVKNDVRPFINKSLSKNARKLSTFDAFNES